MTDILNKLRDIHLNGEGEEGTVGKEEEIVGGGTVGKEEEIVGGGTVGEKKEEETVGEGTEVSLETSVGEVYLKSCLMNASGVRCTSIADLEVLENIEYANGAYISKSCTKHHRVGNPEPRYWEKIDDQGLSVVTINSTGLANHGYEFYRDYGLEMRKKPYFISVAGMSLSENLLILRDLVDRKQKGISGIEFNLSCPNIVGKPQVGYDLNSVKGWFDLIFNYEKIGDLGTPIGLKLPPYFDTVHIAEMAKHILWVNSCGRSRGVVGNIIQWVTCCNSLGNCLIVDPDSEMTVIKPKGGLGGIGGQVVKAVALSNVYQFSKIFNKSDGSIVDVIGCGGVCSGIDAFEHILAGAAAVQIGSQLASIEGNACFNRIASELRDMMASKGYHSLDDFRGKLKTHESLVGDS